MAKKIGKATPRTDAPDVARAVTAMKEPKEVVAPVRILAEEINVATVPTGENMRIVSDGELYEPMRLNGQLEKSLHRFSNVKMFWHGIDGPLFVHSGSQVRVVPQGAIKYVDLK